MKKITLNLSEIEIKLIKLQGQLGLLKSETLIAGQEVGGATMLLAETLKLSFLRIKKSISSLPLS